MKSSVRHFGRALANLPLALVAVCACAPLPWPWPSLPPADIPFAAEFMPPMQDPRVSPLTVVPNRVSEIPIVSDSPHTIESPCSAGQPPCSLRSCEQDLEEMQGRTDCPIC